MEKQAFPDRLDVETLSDQSACDQRRYDAQETWCLYNVLLVVWKGEVAERVWVLARCILTPRHRRSQREG